MMIGAIGFHVTSVDGTRTPPIILFVLSALIAGLSEAHKLNRLQHEFMFKRYSLRSMRFSLPVSLLMSATFSQAKSPKHENTEGLSMRPLQGKVCKQGALMRHSVFLLTIATATALWAQSSASYQVTHTYELGGDGSWDYVVPDPPSHRLYIARQNRVMVVDEDSGKLLGEVAEVHGAHGTAIAAETGHGFATSSEDKSVVMFDLRTFKVLSRIPAAEDADAVLFDGASNRIFTLNGDAHSSTVIDPRAGTLIKNLPLGGKPEYGVSAGDGKVYANLTDTSEVVEIDAKTATVARRWSTAPCKQPVAMAIDKVHHRLFSGCRSGLMAVSDYQAGKVVATVPIGTGVDGAAYDPTPGNAFASNADGTLTVIRQDSPDQYHVLENLPTPVGSRNMGLDPTSHRLFIVSAKFGPVPAGGGRRPVLPGTFTLMTVEPEATVR
jgi:DNA-binding beta-propeller fold protein YncE